MGLLTALFARSLENPSTPLSAPDDWIYDALGSYRSSSGVNVNRETALTYAAVWRAVNLISGDIGKLPLCVYRRVGPGKEEDLTHPAYNLLMHEANDETSSVYFRQTLQTHALLEGNGFAYIKRAGDGTPLELWQLSPTKTYPVRANGKLQYVTELNTGENRRLPKEDVFHLHGLSFDGLTGYSVITKARESLGLGMAAQSFGSIIFRNSARPNVVIKVPGRMEQKAKQDLRESWERMHSGLENSHRTAVLDNGATLEAFQINMRDAQLLETRKFERVEVANWFGTPPHKLGDDSRTSFNSLEQENQSYLDECLEPWFCRWQAEGRRKLLTEEQKRSNSHFLRFNRRELVRANLAARTAYYTAGLSNGFLNQDEVREDDDRNPVPNGEGQKFRTPLNTAAPGEQPPANPDPPAKPAKTKKGQTDDERQQANEAMLYNAQCMLLNAATRMARRIGHAARRAAKKPADFLSWIDTIDAEHRTTVCETLTPPLIAIAICTQQHLAGGLGPSVEASAAAFTAACKAELLEVAGRTTARTLEAAVDAACLSWEVTPPAIAEPLLRTKPNKAARTTEQALDILGRLPDLAGEAGMISVTMPVNEEPPYGTIEPAQLVDAKKRVVKLRKLIATRSSVLRKSVELHVKNPDRYGDPNPNHNLPLDRPYVIKHEGLYYLWDGHHRSMANQLLGVVKERVYLLKV